MASLGIFRFSLPWVLAFSLFSIGEVRAELNEQEASRLETISQSIVRSRGELIKSIEDLQAEMTASPLKREKLEGLIEESRELIGKCDVIHQLARQLTKTVLKSAEADPLREISRQFEEVGGKLPPLAIRIRDLLSQPQKDWAAFNQFGTFPLH